MLTENVTCGDNWKQYVKTLWYLWILFYVQDFNRNDVFIILLIFILNFLWKENGGFVTEFFLFFNFPISLWTMPFSESVCEHQTGNIVIV